MNSPTWMSSCPDARVGHPALLELLARPRGEQVRAVQELRASLPPLPAHEAWNTSFGPGSLFDAWTRASVTVGVYEANRATLQALPAGWVAVEIGGGDGRLWRSLPDDTKGTLVVIDPEAEPLARVAAAVPPGVEVRPVRSVVQDVPLPAADLVVSSLTLHHVAGRSRTERGMHGLQGEGKVEVLRRIRGALTPRRGTLLLNEADVHCEVDLPPGNPLLADRLADSYVRRCARSLLDDIAHRTDADDDLRARWWAIVRLWCLDQLDQAEVPLAARDVYELDVGRWLELLGKAGLKVREHGFTDRYNLFHRYVCTPM